MVLIVVKKFFVVLFCLWEWEFDCFMLLKGVWSLIFVFFVLIWISLVLILLMNESIRLMFCVKMDVFKLNFILLVMFSVFFIELILIRVIIGLKIFFWVIVILDVILLKMVG